MYRIFEVDVACWNQQWVVALVLNPVDELNYPNEATWGICEADIILLVKIFIMLFVM